MKINKFRISSVVMTVVLFVVSLFSFMPVFAADYCDSIPDTNTRDRCKAETANSGSTAAEYCESIPDSNTREQCKAGAVSSSGANPDASPSVKAVFDGRDGGECQGFLGLTSWDCGVHISDEASLKNGIWQIVANIATDITVIAAYLVLGYVIYGGYQYIFSAGDPGKLASGKKTITHAFIGLAIVMSAYVIMSTIRFALLGASGRFDCNPLQEQKCIGNPSDLVSGAIQWVVGVAGLVAAIFVVYGGIAYVTSAGEPSKIQKAKQIILYALIGLAVVGLAELITAFVSGLLRDAGADGSAFTNTNIIAKEIHDNKII